MRRYEVTFRPAAAALSCRRTVEAKNPWQACRRACRAVPLISELLPSGEAEQG